MIDINILYRIHEADDFHEEFARQAEETRNERVPDRDGFVIPGFRMSASSAVALLTVRCLFFLMKKVYYLEQSIKERK